jgi:hypothetical protein
MKTHFLAFVSGSLCLILASACRLGGNIGIGLDGLASLSGKTENPVFIAPRALVAVPRYQIGRKYLISHTVLLILVAVVTSRICLA